MDNHFDVIVIGGGAAGLTAGIYLSRCRRTNGINARNCKLSWYRKNQRI